MMMNKKSISIMVMTMVAFILVLGGAARDMVDKRLLLITF